MDLGLSRITRLVRDHHKLLPWKAIHIAGTNGKGTTSRFLEALLDRSHVNVGLFNSPHLVDRHDCIRIGGQSVTKKLFHECEELVKQRDSSSNINATSFELLTATAYEVFIRAKVEVALIECGLGGRLDATNILLPEEVICSIITRIGLDHQDVLGDTIEEIAAEKAGIIKPTVPVVIDRTNSLSVKQVLRRRAEELNSEVILSTPTESDDYLLNNSLLARKAYYVITDQIRILPRRVKRLKDLPESVISETMQRAASGFGGRFQFIAARSITGKSKRIILDGAHNEQAAKALRHMVDALHDFPTPVTWVIAMSSTKKSETVLNALIKPADSVVFCEFGPVEGMDWVRPQLKEVLGSLTSDLTRKIHFAASPEAALKLASRITPGSSQIVVSGSLYLVGDLIRLIREANQKPEIRRLDIKTGFSSRHAPDRSKGASDSENNRRIEEGLCLYCGDAEHEIEQCQRYLTRFPNGIKLPMNAATQDVSLSDTSEENTRVSILPDKQKEVKTEPPVDWLGYTK